MRSVSSKTSHLRFFKCSMYVRAICISDIVILNGTISMKLSEIWIYMYMLLNVSLIFMICIKLLQIYVIFKCYPEMPQYIPSAKLAILNDTVVLLERY